MYDNFRKKTIFPHKYSKVFYDYWWTQTAMWKAFMERLKIEKDVMVLVSGDTGCQPKGSNVLMANGEWKKIEEIKVGDEVLSPQKDGTNKFSKVKWINEWDCPTTYDVFEINKNKKKLYSCSNNHKIPFYFLSSKRIKNSKKRNFHWEIKEFTSEDISKRGIEGLKHRCIGFSSFGISNFKDRKNCEIEPYSLGIYLGDGYFSKNGFSITSNDLIVIEEIKKYYPIMSISNKKNTTCKSYNFSRKGEFSSLLKKYGLFNTKSGDKFIPKEALLSDINYRKSLLAGLIDSDGNLNNNSYNYTSKSKKLIEDIRDLVYSIGGRTRDIRKIKKGIKSTGFSGTYYSISFYLRDMDIPILTKRRIRDKNFIYKESNRTAIKTVKSSKKRVYGFELDSESHWYITDNWMITKNSGKSHFTGTFAFKHGMKQENVVLNDGSKMFIPEENFIIDPEEFAYKMITKEGQFLWLDEARSVANRRNWFSSINKAVTERKNKNRKLFNIYFLCMPFEKEFDPALGGHLTMWVWVRRGVGEVYVKRSGVKGGTGLNIQTILEREEKYLKENPKKTIVNPAIHPEYCGRIAFSKLTANLERMYKELVKEKKATGDLTDEEKLKYGLELNKSPKEVVIDAIEKIKDGDIKDKKKLWDELNIIELDDEKKLKLLNFYLKLEGWNSFNRLFDTKTVKQPVVEW